MVFVKNTTGFLDLVSNRVFWLFLFGFQLHHRLWIRSFKVLITGTWKFVSFDGFACDFWFWKFAKLSVTFLDWWRAWNFPQIYTPIIVLDDFSYSCQSLLILIWCIRVDIVKRCWLVWFTIGSRKIYANLLVIIKEHRSYWFRNEQCESEVVSLFS